VLFHEKKELRAWSNRLASAAAIFRNSICGFALSSRAALGYKRAQTIHFWCQKLPLHSSSFPRNCRGTAAAAAGFVRTAALAKWSAAAWLGRLLGANTTFFIFFGWQNVHSIWSKMSIELKTTMFLILKILFWGDTLAYWKWGPNMKFGSPRVICVWFFHRPYFKGLVGFLFGESATVDDLQWSLWSGLESKPKHGNLMTSWNGDFQCLPIRIY